MIQTGFLLLAKSSLLLVLAAMFCFAARRRPAAFRHSVWVSAFLALLVLPFGSLLPPAELALPQFVISVPADVSIAATGARSGEWIFGIWLAGVVVLLLRLALDMWRASVLVRRGEPVASHTGYDVRLVPGLSGPAAWGLGSNVVLLPMSARAWAPERLRIVLSHEASHLGSKDCWSLLLAEIACIVYWCNPLVWLAASRMRREQEQAADDEVLRAGVDPTAYAGHLVALARAGRTPVLLAGAASRSDLSRRVEAILDRRRCRAMATKKTMFLCAAALLALALPLASMQAPRQTDRKIYKISDGGIVPPRLLHKVEPGYTQEARDAKIEGVVTLSGVIDVDGRLHEIAVDRGLDGGLDAKAIEAIETWRFEPAQKAGERVAVAVRIEVNFRLL
jgi:TonB family protein